MNNYIEVIGLGGGDINQLPLGIYRKVLKAQSPIYVRTKDHPVIETLADEGVSFLSFDHIYEQENNFSDVYERIVQELLHKAKHQSIIYAVPGHPMLAEETVQRLLNQQDIPVRVSGGSSYLDDLFTALTIDPIDGFQLIDATSFNRHELNYEQHLVFCQVYDQFIASNLKLTLLEDLPADYQVTVLDAVGSQHEQIQTIPLVELDRSIQVSNLTSVYVPPVPKHLLNHTFNRLREVIAILRGPNGCEWDRAQTHESLREYAVEEVYELIDAIDSQDDEQIIEELGDVLLQVLLHSQIGEDAGYFTIEDVIKGIVEKMITRHPHVFGEATFQSIEEIKEYWHQIKLQEKGHQETKTSLLAQIPNSFPALLKAYQLQKKASTVGFDWEQVDDIWDKISEEMVELKEAIKEEQPHKVEEELGDYFFALVNLARRLNINPEIALHRSNQKFVTRFNYIEKKLAARGKKLAETSLEEMDFYWEEAKKGEEQK